MKKKKEETLHELIHSLTSAEKKYIRLNLGKFRPDQSNKKLLLFDVLNQNKNYSTDAEKKAYEREGYTYQHIAADYHELYDLVLEGLSEFNAHDSAAAIVFDGLRKSNVLFEKKLFKQALQQIAKTQKTASAFELWGAVLECMKLEVRCLRVLGYIDNALAVINKQNAIWERQAKVNRLIALHYQSMQLRTQLAKARNEKQLNAFNQLMQDDLLQNEQSLQGFFERFHYWEVFCNYAN